MLDNCHILVVGGAGFVGSNLVNRLLQVSSGTTIAIIDNLLSSERDSIPLDKKVKFTEGSIADDKILSSLNDEFDYVFHLATYHGNQSSIADPLADHANNTLTTLKLYERIKVFRRLKKVVYSSAGCSVAKKTHGRARPTTEDDPIEMLQDSPYSISKIIGEFYSNYYHKQHGVPAVRARFQNVYGPGEILGAGRWRGTPATIWRNVTPTFVYKAISRQPLPLEGGGQDSRDFIYVDDICAGLILCAANGKAGDVYNLASGVETSILELAETINLVAGNDAGFQQLPRRSWDSSGKRFGSTEKSLKELGFRAKIGLREGLEKTVDWTKQNISLIELTMDKHRDRVSG
jgi:nucleoside-diphosphate-sugar epimerase